MNKSKTIKACVLFSIILSLIIAYSSIKLAQLKYKKNRTLNVALNLKNGSGVIDPMQIPTITDAFFINHLYGNLVEIDDQHNLTSSLAESFYWKNKNTLIFTFNKKSPISARDAEFNFKRILFKKNNLHGDLFDLICNPKESTEKCLNRITVVNDYLQINIFNIITKKYLISTFASIDYKIVPIKAFDSENFKIANIINYKITSGHYFLENTLTLKRNNHQGLHFENNFEEFKIVAADDQNIKYKINDESVDIITTTIAIGENDVTNAISKKWNVFETYPISVFMLSFSEKALKEISTADRFTIGNKILNELNDSSIYSSKKTMQFIQGFGEGYLNSNQESKISDLRNKSSQFSPKLSRKIKLGVKSLARWSPFAAKNIEFELQVLKSSALNLKQIDRPDVFGLTNDVSFETNYILLAFAVKNNFLKSNTLSGPQVLQKFINLESDEDRLKFINELHYYSLAQGIVYPMFASPYTTLTIKSLSPNQSKYNSRTLLWKIKEI